MKSVITLLLLMSVLNASGQIQFLNALNWEEVSRKARAEKKLIFLHLENDKCRQCNEVAATGFESGTLKDKFQQKFISLKVNTDTEAGRAFADKFEVKGAPVSLFLDADGNILSRFDGSTSAAFQYAERADIAIGRIGKKQLSDYKKEYKAGARSSGFLEEYIAKKKENFMDADELLEEYVGLLPVDSLKSYRIVRFIYGQGPSLGSRAYKIIQVATPRLLIDSMYKSIPYSDAVAINQAIITSTFSKAVKTKNTNLAYEVARFTGNTYTENQQKGMHAQSKLMVRYYYETRDTSRYLGEARNFLDRFHMVITTDSLQKMDEAERKNQSFSRPDPRQQLPLNAYRFAPPSQFFHMELNEHAWHFYKMATKTHDLERARKWSQRSMEFFDELTSGTQHPMRLGNPAYIDTYAHLLYKLGRKEEAIVWQTKAVEAQKVTGSSTASLEEALMEMKTGTL